GYSAFAGVPILFANDDNVPQATLTALATLNHPHMYILGPGTIIGEHVVDTLRHYGVVHRIRGTSPASNSVAFSSYNESGFGWDVYQPGHGLVFLNADQPLDAAAAAPLSASGDYGPQLILNSATTVPGALTRYLYQLQPGYVANTPGSNQVNAVYNHGWIIGDQNAISYGVQAQIDQDLEIKAESQAALSAAASSVGP
ncbi:MAG TPA: hypothetical protein VHX88_20685, partial [Solirubrobacteraceae bacterium]|nr:hypothetical protein [Solirubrobacteraceae bacterium]